MTEEERIKKEEEKRAASNSTDDQKIKLNAPYQPTSMVSSNGSSNFSDLNEEDAVHDVISGKATKEAVKATEEQTPKLIPGESIGSTIPPPPPSFDRANAGVAVTRPGALAVPGAQSSPPLDNEAPSSGRPVPSALLSARLVDEESQFKDVEPGDKKSSAAFVVEAEAMSETAPSPPGLIDFLKNRNVQIFLVFVALAVIAGVTAATVSASQTPPTAAPTAESAD